MLAWATKQIPGVPIVSVVGGLHLGKSDSESIPKAVKTLSEHPLKWLVPLHCTGVNAVCALNAAFAGRCYLPGVSDGLVLEA